MTETIRNWWQSVVKFWHSQNRLIVDIKTSQTGRQAIAASVPPVLTALSSMIVGPVLGVLLTAAVLFGLLKWPGSRMFLSWLSEAQQTRTPLPKHD